MAHRPAAVLARRSALAVGATAVALWILTMQRVVAEQAAAACARRSAGAVTPEPPVVA